MNNLQTITKSILIIEDDRQIRRFLRTTLASNDYQVLEAATALDGLRQVGLLHPELIILDLGLPDMDGLEVAKQLRKWTSIPILILSAKNGESDQVAALDAGADDYLTKPFSTGELLAHIRAALRHNEQGTQVDDTSIFNTGRLKVDFTHRKVTIDGTETHLSPIEYKLLMVLIQYAGKAVTCAALLREVWGPTYDRHKQYLRVYMAYLRHKIEEDPARPQYILTEPGVGYRLKME